MSRYIDAERLLKALNCFKNDEHRNEQFLNGIRTAISQVEWQPTADVEEVKHGEWLENGANYKCSYCGNTEPYCTDAYCRMCGTKMNKEEKK